MTKQQATRVVIIGAGLAGLAAAYRFAQDGYEVHVYERKAKFTPSGGGIMIRPNASRIIARWGLGDGFDEVSDVAAATVYCSAQTGEVLHKRQAGNFSKFPDYGIDRKTAMRVFHASALQAGATITFGQTVEDVHDNSDGAVVTFTSGDVAYGDFVLVADGILSRLRPKVLGLREHPPKPMVGEFTFHQIQVDEAQFLANPYTKPLARNTDLNVWVGEGRYVVGRYNAKLHKYNAIFSIRETDKGNPRLWDEEGDIGELRSSFQGWSAMLTTLLGLATSCDRWRVAQMPHLSKWTSTEGRLILLGDSAHAMFPDAAQGFSQIVEDVDALSLLLKNEQNSTSHEILQTWQNFRKPRVERIMALAEANHKIYSTGGLSFPGKQPGEQARQQETASHENKPIVPSPDAQFNTPAFNAWVYGYDVSEELEKFQRS